MLNFALRTSTYMNTLAVAKSISFRGGHDIIAIPIVSQSCIYSCKSKESSQGTLYDHEVVFRIASTSTQIYELIDQLQKTDALYIDDVNWLRHTLNRGAFKFKFSIDHKITGSFGSFHGYEINVKLTNLSRALVCLFSRS